MHRLLQPLDRMELREELHFFRIAEGCSLCNQVGNLAGVMGRKDFQHHILHWPLRQLQKFVKKLRGNAAGTDNWSGGWTKVNENGLERIYLPSGSRIQTASETRYTGGGDVYIDKVIIPASDIRELNDIVTIFTNERITQRMGAK